MKNTLILLMVLFSLYSCSNDDYLVDGGVADQHVGMSTYDFLKSNKQLDTLAILIERTGIIEVVHAKSTIFFTTAPLTRPKMPTIRVGCFMPPPTTASIRTFGNIIRNSITTSNVVRRFCKTVKPTMTSWCTSRFMICGLPRHGQAAESTSWKCIMWINGC